MNADHLVKLAMYRPNASVDESPSYSASNAVIDVPMDNRTSEHWSDLLPMCIFQEECCNLPGNPTHRCFLHLISLTYSRSCIRMDKLSSNIDRANSSNHSKRSLGVVIQTSVVQTDGKTGSQDQTNLSVPDTSIRHRNGGLNSQQYDTTP